jgi:hypothetical protein
MHSSNDYELHVSSCPGQEASSRLAACHPLIHVLAATSSTFAAVWDRGTIGWGYATSIDRTSDELSADIKELYADGLGIESMVSYVKGNEVLHAAHFSRRPGNTRRKP